MGTVVRGEMCGQSASSLLKLNLLHSYPYLLCTRRSQGHSRTEKDVLAGAQWRCGQSASFLLKLNLLHCYPYVLSTRRSQEHSRTEQDLLAATRWRVWEVCVIFPEVKPLPLLIHVCCFSGGPRAALAGPEAWTRWCVATRGRPALFPARTPTASWSSTSRKSA